MRRGDRAVILAALDTMKLQVARLETRFEAWQQQQQAPIVQQPAPPPSNALPTAGGIVGLVAGTIVAYAQITGKG